MHPESLNTANWFFSSYVKKGDKVLDVGSKTDEVTPQTYKWVLCHNGYDAEYHGLDIEDGLNVDIVVKDPYNWREIEDGTYDIIICGQTFEHIEFFWEVFREMARVLKPKGYMCVISPSQCKIHRFPVDCWRFLPDGMRALAKYANVKSVSTYCHSPSYKFFVDEKGRPQPNDTVGVFQK
jgi:SAM-dependent methyltransferase